VVQVLGQMPARITLETIKDRTEVHGRYLGIIRVDGSGGVDLNAALIASSHAVPYEGHGKA
jgi:hypothetical protein